MLEQLPRLAYNMQQLAEALGARHKNSDRTARNWCIDNEIPIHKLGNMDIVYASDLHRFFHKNRRERHDLLGRHKHSIG